MFKNAIKINLSNVAKAEIYTISNAITEYVISKSMTTKKLIAIMAGETDPITIVTLNPTTGLSEMITLDLVWEMIERDIPILDDCYEKYFLAKGFLRANAQTVRPHIHCSINTAWSLTTIQGVAPSKIKFYEPNNTVKLDNRKFVSNMDGLCCIENITTLPGDVFSINQLQWHDWTGEIDTVKQEETNHIVNVFSLKNTPSRTDAESLITKLELIK